MNNTQAYPLQWPDGWPRTPQQKVARNYQFKVTPSRAHNHLYDALRRLGARHVVLSTDQVLNKDGSVRLSARPPENKGVAVYFTLDGDQMSMACDMWDILHHNIRSITLAIEGLMQMERHGGAHMMKRAFTGFVALPAPEQWWQVFGFKDSKVSRDDVEEAYRRLAMDHHPDRGGDEHEMARLNVARDEGMRVTA